MNFAPKYAKITTPMQGESYTSMWLLQLIYGSYGMIATKEVSYTCVKSHHLLISINNFVYTMKQSKSIEQSKRD